MMPRKTAKKAAPAATDGAAAPNADVTFKPLATGDTANLKADDRAAATQFKPLLSPEEKKAK